MYRIIPFVGEQQHEVPQRGLEPLSLSAQVPKTCAYTSSATAAHGLLYLRLTRGDTVRRLVQTSRFDS